MEKCIEESGAARKKQSDYHRKNYDYKKVDKEELATLLYNLESLFTFIKKQSRLFAHIIAYFLVVCGLTLTAYFFVDELGTVPVGILIVINLLIMFYGIWLLFLGIKQCFKNDKYLKVLMAHIQDVKKVLQSKDEPN
ncbi:hypothetical protein ACFC4S_27135 [Priestia megaterium]|uniref:hypothetical protein n=1 Tax=Priestia megaterium TaxID=1404 RepID=UPI001D4F0FFB|nr:hypothetical protein [Priestia megaterium]